MFRFGDSIGVYFAVYADAAYGMYDVVFGVGVSVKCSLGYVGVLIWVMVSKGV